MWIKMGRNSLFKKGLVVAVILLFLGMSVISSTGIKILYQFNQPLYTTIHINGTIGDNEWFISNVTIAFEVECGGNCITYYRLDYGEWEIYDGPFVVCADGYHYIKYYSKDIKNQMIEKIKSADFKIDQTPPDIERVKWEAYKENCRWHVKFTCNATDETSNMDRVEMFINDGLHEIIKGAGPIYEFVLEWGCQFWGNPVLNFIHYDVAGNSAIESVNGSDIKSYPYSQSNITQQSQNVWFLWLLERFPLLKWLLDIIGWYGC